MKRCVLMILCTILGPPAATAQLSLDEAFAVLKKRGVTEAELVAASDLILAECADGDEVCIRRLVDVWSDGWAPHQQALMLACQKADDATVGIILDAVARMLKAAEERQEPPGGRLSHRASDFFFKPAIRLCERLSDPEPVARFVVENNRPIHHAYILPTEIRDKYVLMWLRRQTGDSSEIGSSSKAGALSKAVMEELRAIFRELYREHPRSVGAWSALKTLVDFGDQEIIPDLERIVANPPSEGPWARSFEQNARISLVRLRYRDTENEREVYLKGAREEREFGRLLGYYVKGLIRFRVPKASIVEALETNQKPNSFGRDITTGYICFIYPERAGNSPEARAVRGMRLAVDEALLTPDELREYRRERAEYTAKGRPLAEERDELMRRIRISPKFDEKASRADPGDWKAEFPAEVRRLAEIEEAMEALAKDDPAKKWCVQAVIDRAP